MSVSKVVFSIKSEDFRKHKFFHLILILFVCLLYFLKENVKITEYPIETITAVFVCDDYNILVCIIGV